MRRNPDPYLAKARRDEAEAAFSELLAKLRAGKAKLTGDIGPKVKVTVRLDCALPVELYEYPESGRMALLTGRVAEGKFNAKIGKMSLFNTQALVKPNGKKIGLFPYRKDKSSRIQQLFNDLADGLENNVQAKSDFIHEFAHFQRWTEIGREKMLEVLDRRYGEKGAPFNVYLSDPLEHEPRFQSSIRNFEQHLQEAVERDDADWIYRSFLDFKTFIQRVMWLPGVDPNLAAELTPYNPLYRNAIRWFASEYQRLKEQYADVIAAANAQIRAKYPLIHTPPGYEAE